MSIERLERADGSIVWRVRWRQAGRSRSKVLGRKRDAEAFDAELRRRKRTGELAQLDAGKELLADFGDEWWSLHAEPNLARSTLELYAMLWDTHILPRLGSVASRELTPELINRFRLELEADGVGRVSGRKALTLLHGVLQRACEWGRITSNPVAAVRKPPAGRARATTPLAPETVERIRGTLLRSETKTRRRRTVRLLPPLAADLAEWRLLTGVPDDGDLVFPGTHGTPCSRTAYQNWRRRLACVGANRACPCCRARFALSVVPLTPGKAVQARADAPDAPEAP